LVAIIPVVLLIKNKEKDSNTAVALDMH
jgi:hypothetical protein